MSMSNRLVDLRRQKSYDSEIAIYADTRPKHIITVEKRGDDAAGLRRAEDLTNELFKYIENHNVRAVEVFFRTDTDGSGSLDFWEFESALHLMGADMNENDKHIVFSELDTEKLNCITIDAFMQGLRRYEREIRRLSWLSAFCAFLLSL